MKETKYFELFSTEPEQTYYILYSIAARCAGKEQDPDTGKDWSNYEDIDISIIRSSKPMPEAMEKYNVVSNLIFEFTVNELAKDCSSDVCNDGVKSIAKAISNLPIGRNNSHFLIKVDVFD